jgi:uncharacterized protein YpmS
MEKINNNSIGTYTNIKANVPKWQLYILLILGFLIFFTFLAIFYVVLIYNPQKALIKERRIKSATVKKTSSGTTLYKK